MTRYMTAAALLLALALAACGGNDDSSSSKPNVSTGPSADVSGSGDTLTIGERAVVDYVEYGEGGNRKTKLGVTVLKVRKGDVGDFEGFNLDAKQRSSVPYYVDTKVENLGKVPLTRHLIHPTLEDTDGQEHQKLNLIVLSGTFKPCPDVSEKKLAPGETFTGCATVLIPKGKRYARTRFEGDVTADPVFWR